MMGSVIPFDFEGDPVRVVDLDGDTNFVAADICGVLGIAKHLDAMARLDPDERGSVVVDTPGGPQKMAVVNESGLYHLIFKSRKPAAKRFRKWVTSVVLPAIRKTGQFAIESDFEDLEETLEERRTIPEYLSGRSKLTFDELVFFGSRVRRLNQAIGASYSYYPDPELGRLRSYSLRILDLAWEVFEKHRSPFRQMSLPTLVEETD